MTGIQATAKYIHPMPVAIDITDHDIRLARIDNGRLLHLEGYPIPADVDPLTALANAPLPHPLGAVRVSISHPDMLLRVMLQPPAPRERMARIIQFDVQNLGGGEEMLVNWHIPGIGGTGDARVLAQLAKRQLIDRLQEALAQHQGRLESLIDPAVAQFLAFQRNGLTDQGTQVLIDCGNEALHLVIMQDGDLIFYRTHKPGFDELLDDAMELRGVDRDSADRLLRKLGSGAPDDLKNLIRRQGQSVATTINNNIRFAKTQLKLQDLQLDAVYITGKAARLPGLADHIAERLHVPVRLHNPFAALTSGLPEEELDAYAQLPSAWGGSLGLAAAETVPLDVIDRLREAKRAFWMTTGVLRIGAIAAVVIMALAILTQTLRVWIQDDTIEILQGRGDGMVPLAAKAAEELDEHREKTEAIRQRIRYLDNEQRPGRIAVELLNTISSLQDPKKLPVYLRGYNVRRVPEIGTEIEVEGFAEDGSGRMGRNEVLRQFRTSLLEHYPLIDPDIENLSVPIESARLPFRWILTIPDRA